MSQRDRRLCGVALVAVLVSAGAWALWIASSSAGTLFLALGVHFTVAGVISLVVAPSRRLLALALGASVPVLGPVAAAMSCVIAGRGGADLLHDPHALSARIDRAELAHRLTGTIPVCEALASTDVAARRQALAKLKARGSAEDIAILRWARARHSGEATVEVALAFEEVCARFEHRAAAARRLAASAPAFESHAAAFVVLCDGIASGTVDGQLVARVAAEAARHHDAAVALDPNRGRELLAARARLELMMYRPSEALALLGAVAIESAANTELGALRSEAAYAARRFELVPEVLREAP